MSELNANQDLIDILELVTTGMIGIEDAAARITWAADHPGQPDPAVTCETCRFWRRLAGDTQRGTCSSPMQPEHLEHRLSIRCIYYDRRDERADALPVTPARKNGLLLK